MGISRRQGDHTRSGAHSSSRGLRSYFLSYKGRFHLHSSFLFATNVLTQDEPGSALGRGWRAFAGSNFNTPSPPGSHWVPATVFSMPYAQPVPMAMFGGVCRTHSWNETSPRSLLFLALPLPFCHLPSSSHSCTFPQAERDASFTSHGKAGFFKNQAQDQMQPRS